MKRMFWPFLFFWMTCGSTAMAAIDGCTAEDVSKLKRDGWSVEEIKDLCANSSANKSSTQQKVQVGQRCATKLGVCNLFDIEPAPVGSPCYCNNPNTGRADHGQIIR